MKHIIKTSVIASLLIASVGAFAQQSKTTEASKPKQGNINVEQLKEISVMAAEQGLRVAQQSLKAANDELRAIGFVTNDNANERIFDLKDLKQKEVSVELSAPKGGDVYIESSSRTIEIKTWDQPKVKVSTTIYYEGDATKLSDAEWFEKLNLTVKTLGNSVIVKSGTVSGGGSYSYGSGTYSWSSGGSSGVAIFDETGKNLGTKSNLKRIVTVYVPSSNKIDIDTKYADVNISGNSNKISLNITNGNAELGDVNNLILRSKYSNVSCGDVKTGEVEFINGRFTAKNCTDLDVDTKYSTVEIGSAKQINIRSTNDEYEIDEAGTIYGRKNYGNLRITNLTGSFELDGTNADVKIRNMAATVTNIRVDNKYADLRLPIREIKNYTIKFNGPWSTVYGNFEKQPLPETIEEKKKTTETGDALADQIRRIERSVNTAFTSREEGVNSRFMATGGTGKGATLDIKCQNCTVDFK